MRIAAILVAAGSGIRFGAEAPKQFVTLGGKPVIRHAAEALAPHVSLLQPVGDLNLIEAALHGIASLRAIPGGSTRQDSVRAGLEALVPYEPDIVLVHDAARPVIPPSTIPALLAALREAHGAIPAAPVADTLKRVVRGVITETVSRTGLFRAQTPQASGFPPCWLLTDRA
jgi:2-C-methyl-D-erythritol 4-phosphate cytidylyltransferase/2-C-methyl-D-erythritol 2,4-cyclodiphosphate synthase